MKTTTWDAGWQLWDLIGFLADQGVLHSGAIFRGHANADWQLVPALYRRELHIYGGQSQEELYVVAERRMLDAFFDRAALLLPRMDRSEFLDRVIAQHYGVPTQLLDWTLDPFIALYFVVSDPIEESTDGALFFISPLQGHTQPSRLTFPFSGRITGVSPPVIDNRVAAQKSVFTLQSFGSDEKFIPLEDRSLKVSKPEEGTLPRDEVGSFGKIIVPAPRKLQILQQLMDLGIDAAQMFPGLQGIGQRIATHARLKNYGGDGRF